MPGERGWLSLTGRAAMTLAFTAMKQAAGDPRRVEVIASGLHVLLRARRRRAGGTGASHLRRGPGHARAPTSTRWPTWISVACSRSCPRTCMGCQMHWRRWKASRRRHGIFMLDDAAQALGATYRGRPAGNFGDVGLYSFDKGKNITTLQGGVLVADSGGLSVRWRRRWRSSTGVAVRQLVTLAQAASVRAAAASLAVRGRAQAAARSRAHAV